MTIWIGWESWRHCVVMVLVLDNIQFCWVRLFLMMSYWIFYEAVIENAVVVRNEMVNNEGKESIVCFLYFTMLWNACDSMRWVWKVKSIYPCFVCVNEYADRYILTCVRCMLWSVGFLVTYHACCNHKQKKSGCEVAWHWIFIFITANWRMYRLLGAGSQESCHFTGPGTFFIPPVTLRSLAVLMASLRKIMLLWYLDCWVRSHWALKWLGRVRCVTIGWRTRWLAVCLHSWLCFPT